MSHFICPVCQGALSLLHNSLRCANGHCYDLSRRGYVNLLMSQKVSQKRHGDDKAMAKARGDFLDKGYYQPLLELLLAATLPHLHSGDLVLDSGCGEGWYTHHLYQALCNRQVVPHMLGIDISRDTLELAARRNPQLELAVASAWKLPVADHSCQLVLSVFAPYNPDEVARVLCHGGVFVHAYPLEKHLLALKQAVYASSYQNTVQHELPEGFTLLAEHTLRDTLLLDSPRDIQSLFMMTPYYYKTSAADQQKLMALESLETELEFGVSVLQHGVFQAP